MGPKSKHDQPFIVHYCEATARRSPRLRKHAAPLRIYPKYLSTTVSIAALFTATAAHAVDGTWLGPGAEFTTGSNWNSAPLVPDGTATFTGNTPTTVTISNSATLNTMQFVSGAPAYTFNMQSVGSLTLDGIGIVNNSNAAPTFSVSSGTTLAFDGISTAANAIIINNGGITDFATSSTAGTATITNSNGGSTAFVGDATAGNATITTNSGSETIFTNDTTGGSATIINAGGVTTFEDGATPGNARLVNSGAGSIFDLSLTFGPHFDSRISAGSIEGDGIFYLGGNELTVGSNNLSTTVTGTISDGGILFPTATGASLVKVGSGTLTLAGINTYTGETTVDGGTLNVTGSIASSSMTTVNAGTLTGTGTVSNTTIAAGGILTPGNGTPGTAMTVSGNLTFASGAQYVVNINPTTSSLANVSGTATLGGATVNAIYANGSYVDKRYTILTATGGVNGTFNSLVNTNLPANFSAALAYNASNAFLDLTLNFTPPSPPPPPGAPEFGTGLNINQQNVADTLVNFFNTTGSIPLAFGTLTPAGLTQVSGELATGTQQATFDAMTQFMGVMTDASGMGRGFATCGDGGTADYVKAPRVDCFASRWNVWAAGYGGGRTTDGNAVVGSNTATGSVYGVAVGADYRISPDTLAGFALAGGGTSFDVANGLGSGRSDLFQAGAFIHHDMGASYLTGALAYGWQDVTTDRTLALAGIDRLRADFNANAFSGRLEGGYRFATAWGGLTPYAAGQFTTYDLPDYAEQALAGTNLFALNYDARTDTASRSELGLRTDKSFALADGVLTLRGRFAWAHNFDTNRSIAANFQTLPGTSFVVNGAAIGANSALTSVAAEMSWRNGWSLAATFDGEFSDVSTNYAGRGVLRYQW